MHLVRVCLAVMDIAYDLADGPHDRAARCFGMSALSHQEDQRPGGVDSAGKVVDFEDRQPQACSWVVRRPDGVAELPRVGEKVRIGSRPAI